MLRAATMPSASISSPDAAFGFGLPFFLGAAADGAFGTAADCSAAVGSFEVDLAAGGAACICMYEAVMSRTPSAAFAARPPSTRELTGAEAWPLFAPGGEDAAPLASLAEAGASPSSRSNFEEPLLCSAMRKRWASKL